MWGKHTVVQIYHILYATGKTPQMENRFMYCDDEVLFIP